MPLLKPVPQGISSAPLTTPTIRDFSGGWNVVDSQLNMQSKYQPVLDNVIRGDDGSLAVRQGTTGFITLQQMLDNIPAVSAIPFTEGITFGSGASAGQAFNGTRLEDPASCAIGDSQELIVGKEYAATRNVFAAVVFPSDEFSYSDADTAIVQLHLEGSVDNVTWEVLDCTLDMSSDEIPATGTALSWSASPLQLKYGEVRTVQQYRWIRVRLVRKDGQTSGRMIIGEVEFYETPLGLASDQLGYIVHVDYFQDHTLLFASTGRIFKVSDDKVFTEVWNDTIANTLPGNPAGWTNGIDFVSTDRFGGQLIVCNGVDKPLLIDVNNANEVEYLQDLGTLSNANTPICRYVLSMADYVLMAGDPLEPATVYISQQGTSGTYVGDPDPPPTGSNDAVNIDLSKKVSTEDVTIRGLARFRKQVAVAFDDVSVMGTLGLYDGDGNHTPDFTDIVPAHGSIAHHAMVDIGNDLLMCDNVGVPSLQRGTFTAEAEPTRVSELIDPRIQSNIGHLKIATTTKYVHAFFNALERQYMLFVPNHDPDDDPITLVNNPLAVAEVGTGRLYISVPNRQHFLPNDRVEIRGATAFNLFTAEQLNGIHTVTAVPDSRSLNVIEVLIEGATSDSNPNEQIGGGNAVEFQGLMTETLCYAYSTVSTLKIKAWARFRGWGWLSATRTPLKRILMTDGRQVVVLGTRQFPSSADYVNTGRMESIEWAWETPWIDYEVRMNKKRNRYLSLDTVGYATFEAMMFVDQIYYGVDNQLSPVRQMTMSGGSTGGFGNENQPYGGGRRTSTERLYAWTGDYKLAKLRFQGVTTEPLRFVSVSLAYRRGSIRR